MHDNSLLYWMIVLISIILRSESAPSSGCGKSIGNDYSRGDTTSLKIPKTKGQPVRHYRVHLPIKYQNNQPHAIVFSFHGRKGHMNQQEDLSQLSQKGLIIRDAGIIAVYPQGKEGQDGKTAWQGANYSDPHVDDVSVFYFDFIRRKKSTII